MVREVLFSNLVTSELRQEHWDETSHAQSQKSLLEETHSKYKGTEAEHVQDTTHNLMKLSRAVADLLVWVVFIFIQRLKETFGEITGLES